MLTDTRIPRTPRQTPRRPGRSRNRIVSNDPNVVPPENAINADWPAERINPSKAEIAAADRVFVATLRVIMRFFPFGVLF